MSDQSWAALTAFLTLAGLRALDWFLPKGRYSRWAERHSVGRNDRSAQEAADDAALDDDGPAI